MHENAGEHGKASEAFEVAIDYCASTGIAGTRAVCSACLTHVLRQRGEWRRSLALSRTLVENPDADPGSRAIAASVMSQIHASRGERRPARLRVMEAAPVVRQLRIFGAEMECSWTLARLEVLEGSVEGALEHGRDLLRRWEESEDRHYSLNALGWLSGLFAEHRQEEDLQRVVRALGAIAEENGNREALAMLARALGELAQAHGDPAGAIAHFERAIDLHQELELPHDRAELLVSAAAAACAAGREDQAREWLTEASAKARRLGARPLLATAEQALAQLGAGAVGRGGVRRPDAPAAADHPPRRRGAHEPRDRRRALPVGAHGRHARAPLADRARVPLPHRRGPQGLGARPARAPLTRSPGADLRLRVPL